MAAFVAQVFSQVQRWSSPLFASQSDAALLKRFVRERDETAFAALVARHGPMVLRTCRRVLGDAHEAEDAFQATFLILVRKAPTLKQPEALIGFLHVVACRVARKARTKSSVRCHHSPLLDVLLDASNDPLACLSAREVLAVLDEEVARLPAAQQSVVLLCCLEGQTREEAARILGWTAGSVKGHLERGRRRLQARLRRRGIALTAALALTRVSRGAVPLPLRASAIRVAFNADPSDPATALAGAVLNGMSVGKFTSLTALLLTVALGVSVIAFTYRIPATDTPVAVKPSAPPQRAAHLDAQGDPLPAEAITRLGTVRLRHGDWIHFVAFTPDGKRLVSQGADGVRTWDAATGKERSHLAPAAGSRWGATDLTPDGKRMAVADDVADGPFYCWDVQSGKKSAPLGQGGYPRLRFSPDGKLLAANSWSAGVEVWDVASQKRLHSWKPFSFHQVGTFAFSADSRKLLASGNQDTVRIWDVKTGKQLQKFTRFDWKSGAGVYSSQADALSPDGNLIALIEVNEKSTPKPGKVQWKARISLRDVATGKLIRQLICPSQEVYPGQAPQFSAMTFTADGKKLLTGGPDHFVRVWDTATGKELNRWPLVVGSPKSLNLSKDEKTLAVVMLNRYAIQLLDVATGKVRTSPAGHLGQVYLAGLTPDKRSAITTGGDSALLLWDVAGGRMPQRLEGHKDPINALEIARDGRTLFTAAWDKTLRVWDVAGGQENGASNSKTTSCPRRLTL
jgi:RNA polymerase sigma factor (sigma-70 family)